LAKHTGLEASDFYYYMGNCHIYESHIEELNKQINNSVLYNFPTLEITNKCNDINDYEENMFIINNYKCGLTVKMDMVA
jgi:thymidylate synthase